ncbi:helix-turn-helix domain-containing protein [Nakamurella aerolata]|nr:helix-turn-helix transcriptional regulator [Nakamurella aerolata]
MSTGQRVAFYRRRRGLTQGVLAGLIGRSEDWLSKVERNQRRLNEQTLTAVAQALRVMPEDIKGQPVLAEADRPANDDVPAVREALLDHRRLSATLFAVERSFVDVDAVAAYSRNVWDLYQRGQTGAVISELPRLIRDAQALEASGDSDGRPWAVSARIHHLAATTLAKLGESELAWTAGEQAMRAAERSGDPLAIASASRATTHALLAMGRFDHAVELGQRTADWLNDQLRKDDPAALSLLGMLHLRTAIAASQRQDRAATNELLDRAEALASRLGRDANLWQTSFGPTNVRLHRVAANLNLEDVAWVIEHGAEVNSSQLPIERTVAHKIDLARANSYHAKDQTAVEYLIDAEHLAPDLVRQSAAVRETVKSMLHRNIASTGKGSLLGDLAVRCRAV